MHEANASVPPKRKRQLSGARTEVSSPSPPAVTRSEIEDHQRHRTPSCFWDKLSRQWLTRRTLREFNRRTLQAPAPTPCHRISSKTIAPAELERFARQDGPSLGDIKGVSPIQPNSCCPDVVQYSKPEVSVASNAALHSSQSGSRKRARYGKESDVSLSTTTSSAYDAAFKQHLVDHGIYKSGRTQRPSNWSEINERLAKSRSSLSPSRFTEAAFEDFEETNEKALAENTVMSRAFPIIAGSAGVYFYSQDNVYFGNLKDLTDGTITKAKPDLYNGAHPSQLDKSIRNQLSECIEPSSKKNVPLLPNFFVEGNGPDGSACVNELQALYDGALGERGMLELSLYIDPGWLQYNVAHTIASTYHGGTGDLTLYSIHAVQPASHQLPMQFRMTKLNGWKMTGNANAFREGATAWRNARDWAYEERTKLISAANSKMLRSEHSAFHSSMETSGPDLSRDCAQPASATSADELSFNVVAPSSINKKSSAGAGS